MEGQVLSACTFSTDTQTRASLQAAMGFAFTGRTVGKLVEVGVISEGSSVCIYVRFEAFAYATNLHSFLWGTWRNEIHSVLPH